MNDSSFLAWLRLRIAAIHTTYDEGERAAALRMAKRLRVRTIRLVRAHTLDEQTRAQAKQDLEALARTTEEWELSHFMETQIAAFELGCLALYEWPEA